ncbi:MAG: imidazoleglycerol-phosphate dehydratase [Peptococcaceae bacterium BRH_c4b]|nr:MAG: imidazoleglycerol-phosphate dehydratase [Peptococcaceae bacterium BRH_c4b]
MQIERKSTVTRKTAETEINLELLLDGRGESRVSTGVGFFDHMLTLLARHGSFDLNLSAAGDLQVDCHHTVEDVGICLGRALNEALGERSGISRYGHIILPMDEALALVAVDLSGRGHSELEASFPAARVGSFDTEMVGEFLRAFAVNAGVTLHVRLLAGVNCHHMIEAVFKGLGRALALAVSMNGKEGVPSSKGILV